VTSRSRLLPVAVVMLVSCRGGCRPSPPPAPPVDEMLAGLPAQTRVVAAVDLARVRGTVLWTRLAALADEDPADRARIQALTARTGLDPLRQIRRIVAAFPDSARTEGKYALVIDGQGFDARRLVDYAREEAAPRGIQIQAVPRAGQTLYLSSGPAHTAGFFPGPDRFVLGGGGWAELMADRLRPAAPRLDPPDGGGSDELARLCARIDRSRALWFAAIVPLDVRRILMDDPAHDSAASVTRLAVAADLGPGLSADLVADLSNAADAKILVERIRTSAREAKRNAKVLMLGLAPYLDALTARADGATLRVSLSLTEPQMRDLVDRMIGLVRVARGR
jgi:hypothetical protein